MVRMTTGVFATLRKASKGRAKGKPGTKNTTMDRRRTRKFKRAMFRNKKSAYAIMRLEKFKDPGKPARFDLDIIIDFNQVL
jgi:hypothetical protein